MHIAPWLLAVVPFAAVSAQSPKITGALNFRDVGGLLTSDGRTVTPGLYFRSGELNSLSSVDFETLASLHITYIFDLRTDAERTAAPTVWGPNPPMIVPVAVGIDAKGNPAAEMQAFFAAGTEPANAVSAMQSMTAKLAIDGAPAIGKILLALSKGDEPAIIHCTAGKDRTGIVTAVLLTLLGVSKEEVYKDYLASNSAVPAQMMRLRQASSQKSGMPSALTALPFETIKVLMGVDRSYLDAAFAAIDAKFGSFDAYAANGLNLTPTDIEALRKRFTH